ncbi:MAG: hypothetical protein ABTQ32_37715 [Myxococcaceae bacterium]
MSTTRLFVFLTLFTACRPAFDTVDPALCSGTRPTAVCGPGCRLLRHEAAGRSPRTLNEAPLELTREVSPMGWRSLERSGPKPSVGGVTSPLTVNEVLAASGDEVLFKTGPVIASLDASTGDVSRLMVTTGLPFRWATGPAGGFFVLSGRSISPSAPRHGERVVTLPAAPTLVAAPSRAPLPTDVTSGVILIPTSNGLFSFQPAATVPLTRLATGAFTSVALFGGEVYASRCAPLPSTASAQLEATSVIPLDAPCEILRGPLGATDAFVTIATQPGVIELLPKGDRLLVRSAFELTSLTRSGARVLLYAVTPPASPSLTSELVLGPLEADAATPSFRSGICVVSLDEKKGTTLEEPANPLELELGLVRVSAVPAN